MYKACRRDVLQDLLRPRPSVGVRGPAPLALATTASRERRVQGNSEAAGFIGGPRDGLVNPHEDVRARLGVTEPGRRGSPADVFTAGRPLHHVLIPGCVVIAEIAEVIDIDREQVKVSWLGLPSESLRDRVRVTMLQAAVLLASGMTAYLEFPVRAVAAGDHAAHEDARSRARSAALADCHSIDSHRSSSMMKGSTGLSLGVPSRRIVAARTTPGFSRCCRPTSASFGWRRSSSHQFKPPPSCQVACQSWSSCYQDAWTVQVLRDMP
jgi:hypothetical protein